mmetsp:Transcript_161211/g.517568  ORF Transcript_161211/g.517568 Transcript_161211/m.517568 type:complete len:491 (-) Transcript_161211:153-1625(-)
MTAASMMLAAPMLPAAGFPSSAAAARVAAPSAHAASLFQPPWELLLQHGRGRRSPTPAAGPDTSEALQARTQSPPKPLSKPSLPLPPVGPVAAQTHLRLRVQKGRGGQAVALLTTSERSLSSSSSSSSSTSMASMAMERQQWHRREQALEEAKRNLEEAKQQLMVDMSHLEIDYEAEKAQQEGLQKRLVKETQLLVAFSGSAEEALQLERAAEARARTMSEFNSITLALLFVGGVGSWMYAKRNRPSKPGSPQLATSLAATADATPRFGHLGSEEEWPACPAKEQSAEEMPVLESSPLADGSARCVEHQAKEAAASEQPIAQAPSPPKPFAAIFAATIPVRKMKRETQEHIEEGKEREEGVPLVGKSFLDRLRAAASKPAKEEDEEDEEEAGGQKEAKQEASPSVFAQQEALADVALIAPPMSTVLQSAGCADEAAGVVLTGAKARADHDEPIKPKAFVGVTLWKDPDVVTTDSAAVACQFFRMDGDEEF